MLTGANNYQGDTIVSAGTLVGSVSSIPGNVADGSRFSVGSQLWEIDSDSSTAGLEPCRAAMMMYDDVIMRTIVDLTEEQLKSLAALCAAKGISRAEAVRRAVTRLLAEEQRPDRARAFGAWKRQASDGAGAVRRLRDEWER